MADHAELAVVHRGGVVVGPAAGEHGGLTGELAGPQHPDELLGAVRREPEDLETSRVQHEPKTGRAAGPRRGRGSRCGPGSTSRPVLTLGRWPTHVSRASPSSPGCRRTISNGSRGWRIRPA